MEINLKILLEVILENKQDKLIGECLKRQLDMQPKFNPIEAITKIAEASKTQESVELNTETYITVDGKTAVASNNFALVLQGFNTCQSKLQLVRTIANTANCNLTEAKQFVDKLQAYSNIFGILLFDKNLSYLEEIQQRLIHDYPELTFNIHPF